MGGDSTFDFAPIFVGFIVVLVLDGAWLWLALPMYNGVGLHNGGMVCKLTRGANGDLDVPSMSSPALRRLAWLLNSLLASITVAWACQGHNDVAGGAAGTGALIGFYVYFVFNASTAALSYWPVESALVDTVWGTSLFTVLGLAIDGMTSLA